MAGHNGCGLTKFMEHACQANQAGAFLVQAQSSTESSLTEMEAEVRENKRLVLEQKCHSAEQAARQEALERDVAALKAMLEKVTRMLLEKGESQSNFPFSGTTVSVQS